MKFDVRANDDDKARRQRQLQPQSSLRMGKRKSSKKQSGKKKSKTLKRYPVRKFVQVTPVEGTECAVQYTLTPETIYQISRNRIKYAKEPKIEANPNKTQDLRDEFSAYCGMKKTIKNWLFYV